LLVGVLAIHGSFHLHQRVLNRLNISNVLVKNKKDLNKTDALIMPGGESTVISQILYKTKLDNEIINYSKKKSIYGTCAGGIIMSSKIDDKIVNPLKIFNISAERNSWGRQIDSFTENVTLSFSKDYFKAFFIRAPKYKILSKNIKVLSKFKGEPILMQEGKHLVSSFHPELGLDTRVHKYFIQMVSNEKI